MTVFQGHSKAEQIKYQFHSASAETVRLRSPISHLLQTPISITKCPPNVVFRTLCFCLFSLFQRCMQQYRARKKISRNFLNASSSCTPSLRTSTSHSSFICSVILLSDEKTSKKLLTSVSIEAARFLHFPPLYIAHFALLVIFCAKFLFVRSI